jgi:predicted metal-binding transcription factor (methanogenesis marker protein 9)
MGKKQIILVKKGLIYLTFLLFLFAFCSGCVKSCKIRPDLEKIGDSALENIENLTETNLRSGKMACKF